MKRTVLVVDDEQNMQGEAEPLAKPQGVATDGW